MVGGIRFNCSSLHSFHSVVMNIAKLSTHQHRSRKKQIHRKRALQTMLTHLLLRIHCMGLLGSVRHENGTAYRSRALYAKNASWKATLCCRRCRRVGWITQYFFGDPLQLCHACNIETKSKWVCRPLTDSYCELTQQLQWLSRWLRRENIITV